MPGASAVPPEYADVVIVGAGLSGLAAARIIVEHNAACHLEASAASASGRAPESLHHFASDSDAHRPLSVVVLEAADRVGGRTLVDSDGTDLGGAYIGPTQDRIAHLVDILDLKLKKVNTDGDVAFASGSKRGLRYSGLIPPLHFLALLDLNDALVRIDRLSSTVDPVNPHLSPRALEFDDMSVESWIGKTCYTKDAASLLRTSIRAILCSEPSQVSFLALLAYIRQSGGPMRIFETRGGAQDSKVEGGTGQIALRLAERLEATNARLDQRRRDRRLIYVNCAVRNLNYSHDRLPIVSGVHYSPSYTQRSFAEGAKTFEIQAKYVILAIPPSQAHRIDYSPPLSPQRAQALQRYPMGHLIKTFMYYSRPWWRDMGMCGSVVKDNGVVQVALDNSDALVPGAGGCIMGFALAHVNEQLATSADARQRVIAQEYAEAFKCDLALHPVGYKEKVWAEEPTVGGCYTGICGPRVITDLQMIHTKHLSPRVFVAGTEAARCFTGYMDGAVEAGERCGRNVLVAEGVLPSSDFDTVSMPPASLQNPLVAMGVGWSERLTPNVPQFFTAVALGVGALALTLASRWSRPKKN